MSTDTRLRAVLRDEITKLDTEIGSQRALLRKLERDRNLTQRRLNTILDPMSPRICGALHGPMLLLSVCHTWSDIALATAALWTTMHRFPKVVLTWLERARNRPIISLQGTFDQDVVGIIWEHGQQLKHLEISEVEDARVINALWEGTADIARRNAHNGLSSREIFQLLRLAPNLTECHFVNGHNLHDFDTGKTLVLSRLRRLTFGARTLPTPSSILSLPHLEALVIMRRRSSPPLRELALGSLILPPHVVSGIDKVMDQIFAAFIESPSLLPHLDTFSGLFRSFWENLNRVLIAWRTQLKGFHLILPYKLLDSQMPAPEIITSLRELAVDGLHVQLTAIADQWDYTFD
ncbi:hypothetical protein B0H14DRAFT_2826103 [Mycena olivaceomarginata]|nr:hypothetical protein B0H14DRAFT_2826103 [Mycena olivaceomarginata]